jgi:hypothetical protein
MQNKLVKNEISCLYIFSNKYKAKKFPGRWVCFANRKPNFYTGTCHVIFCLWFFHQKNTPTPQISKYLKVESKNMVSNSWRLSIVPLPPGFGPPPIPNRINGTRNGNHCILYEIMLQILKRLSV